MVKRTLGKHAVAGVPYFALILASMCLFTVLCFMFPEYMTTPEIRSNYPIPLIRILLFWSLWVASAAALTGLLLLPARTLSAIALLEVAIAQSLGGAQVYLKEEYESFAIHLGLDWFLLDLFILAIVFVPLEAFFPRHPGQAIVRPELRTDLVYFAVGHMGIQLIVLLTQQPADVWLEFLRVSGQSSVLSQWPLPLQIVLGLFVGDLCQYWIHRGFHTSAWLWKFHKIHHSIKTLDWLAGSRLHLLDITVMRTLVYAAVMYLGLSSQAFAGYVLLAAFQTVFIHTNIGIRFGWLSYVLTTPRVHHWHHHDRPAAYDKNYAVHFPIIDILFGTFYLPREKWPSVYGIEDPDYPSSYWGQFIAPFHKHSADRNT